jgi:hypothetical protein
MNSDIIMTCPAKGLVALQAKPSLKVFSKFPCGALPVVREQTNRLIAGIDASGDRCCGQDT